MLASDCMLVVNEKLFLKEKRKKTRKKRKKKAILNGGADFEQKGNGINGLVRERRCVFMPNAF